MSRRALVTGATGGLGLALVETLLAEGYVVRATGRRQSVAPRLAALGAEVVLADLEQADPAPLCQGLDVVFHAAALSSPWGPDAVFQRANVIATDRLLAAARAAGVARFVFVSSPSVYTCMADRVRLTEDDPPAARPMNAYARTKLEAERRVLAADGGGMRTTAIRPRALIGPDDAVLLPRVIRLVKRGRFPLFRQGRGEVELTDVRDGARALMLADRAEGAAGQVFNISGGRPVPVKILALALSEALDRPIRLIPVPMATAQLAAHAAEKIAAILPGRPEPPLTPYSLAALAYSQTFDLSRAEQVLGYRPQHDALATARALAPSLTP